MLQIDKSIHVEVVVLPLPDHSIAHNPRIIKSRVIKIHLKDTWIGSGSIRASLFHYTLLKHNVIDHQPTTIQRSNLSYSQGTLLAYDYVRQQSNTKVLSIQVTSQLDTT